MKKLKQGTLFVRQGDAFHQKKLYSHDVVTPIHLSTTNYWDQIDKPGPFEYIRSESPTRTALEGQLAAIENAHYGLAFASGLAAETALLMGTLKAGDHIIGFDDLYGGTIRLIDNIFNNFQITADYIDLNNESLLKQSIKPSTRIIWIESPTNPLMKIANIRKISSFAHQHNILVVVDNTFLSPYFQNPLDLGADIVLHSGTKYLGGHSDVLNGALMVNDTKLYEKLKLVQNSTGGVLSPFDSYQVLRGIKTLAVRMKAHEQNALKIAVFLENHPKIKKVYYPGLPSFAQYELAKSQASGFGGMISFELTGKTDAVKRFFENLELFILAESLGGVESLIEHPATMTHASLTAEQQLKAGITESLIRMSVGIEDCDDLLADLERALDKI
jgi:cystathionine gamma-lyase